MQRIGTVGRAWLDGDMIYDFTVVNPEPAIYVTMRFGGADSEAFAPLHVDLVEMTAVPETSTVLGLLSGVKLFVRRERGALAAGVPGNRLP